MTTSPSALSPALYRTLGAFRGALSHYTHEHQRLVQQSGLTPQQYSLLVLLGGADRAPLSVGELAEQLHIAHNSAVGLAQRAERAGLIERAADPERGHRTLLRLTPAGAAQLAAATQRVITALAGERQALVETLTRWTAALQGGRETPWGESPVYTLRPAATQDRALVWHLLQLHLHEGSAFRDDAPGDQGEYAYPAFESYWQGEARRAFLLHLRRPAAFALVVQVEDGAEPWHEIEELHVLRQYRGQRLGCALVADLLRTRPGRWSALCHPANTLGLVFWRNTLGALSVGPLREERLDGAQRMWRFTLDGVRP